MRIAHSWTYDAPLDQVYDMTLDRRFQEMKCRHASAVTYSADVARDPAGTDVITVERSMSTDGLPSQMRSFIGQTIDIVERQTWSPTPADDGTRRADLRVEIKAAPVAFNATIVMRPHGAGTSLHVEGDLTAKVPLFGARIEEAAAPAVTGAIEIEQETGREYLAG